MATGQSSQFFLPPAPAYGCLHSGAGLCQGKHVLVLILDLETDCVVRVMSGTILGETIFAKNIRRYFIYFYFLFLSSYFFFFIGQCVH